MTSLAAYVGSQLLDPVTPTLPIPLQHPISNHPPEMLLQRIATGSGQDGHFLDPHAAVLHDAQGHFRQGVSAAGVLFPHWRPGV